jgi:hypothetical protein
MRQEPGPAEGQGGFAAVDALVAVTILSSSLALSLTAAEIGMRASRTAGETRDAELVLRGRLEDTAGQAGVWSGRVQGLSWRIEAHRSDDAVIERAGPCVRTASATSTRSGRTYRLTTVDTCPPEAGE